MEGHAGGMPLQPGGPPNAQQETAAQMQEAAARRKQLQHQLTHFWNQQWKEMEEATDFRNHNLPLARIKKIMKSDEEVRVRAFFFLLCFCSLSLSLVSSWRAGERILTHPTGGSRCAHFLLVFGSPSALLTCFLGRADDQRRGADALRQGV
jgi:hypothetical protein